MHLPFFFILLLLCLSNPLVVRSQDVDSTVAPTDPPQPSGNIGIEDATVAYTTQQENDIGSVTTESVNFEPVEVTTIAGEAEYTATNQSVQGTTLTITTTESTSSVPEAASTTTEIASTTTIKLADDTTSTVTSTTESTSTSSGSTTLRPASTSTSREAEIQTSTAQITTSTIEPTTTTETTTISSTLQSTRRPTIPSTTGPVHECVTSMSCADPNAHCVSVAGRNTCQCRIGYRKTTRGACLALATTQPPSSTVNPTSINPTTTETATDVSTTSNSAGSDLNHQKIPVKKAEDLSPDDELDVISIGFRPSTSVIEWILGSDSLFRSTIAKILTNTGLHTSADEDVQHLNITLDQVLYVAPSPQRVEDELLVCFVVENVDQVPIMSYSSNGVIARHRRDLRVANATVPKYFPAFWILQALRQNQEMLQESLNQTIVTLYSGEIPRKLFFQQWTSIALFQQNLHVFIPLILAMILLFVVIVSVACVKAKKRATATWDPPAGIIFGNRKPHTVMKEEREDPLGSVNKVNASGQDLATDEQCREGEDHHAIKPARLNSEDDVWVVPFEDGPSEATRSAIRAQFEDTKL